MLRTKIKTISHDKHRYDTVGDYRINGRTGYREILVSEMDNEDYEFLVAVHELIEEYLTRKRGIKEEDITKFDMYYEDARQEGDITEPGNSPLAPYFKEHQFATIIEKQIADELGVDWEEYDKVVCSL